MQKHQGAIAAAALAKTSNIFFYIAPDTAGNEHDWLKK
jgi:hypothetical protein